MFARLQGPPHRRRGFGLVEMAVSGVIFVAMVILTIQLVGWVAVDRKATSRREAATRLVGTVMERVLARPWPEITTEALAPLARESGDKGVAAPGILKIEVVSAPAVDGRGQKRVLVAIEWPDRSKIAESPVRLVAWTSERKGTQP